MIEYLPQAVSSLNTAIDIGKTLAGLRDSSLLADKTFELQSNLIEASRQMSLTEREINALLSRISDMEQEIMRLKDWSDERKSYELNQLAAGVFAYVKKGMTGEPEALHKLCCSCYDKSIKSTLQQNSSIHRETHLVCPHGCPDLIFRDYLR